MMRRSVRLSSLTWCTFIVPALIGCAELDATDSPSPGNASSEVAQQEQALNTAQPGPSEAENPTKGHVKVLQAAFAALGRRGDLLPPLLRDWSNQYYVYYGNDFADHPWVGRPGTASNPKATGSLTNGWAPNSQTVYFREHAINGEVPPYDSGEGYYSWDAWTWGFHTGGLPIPVTMHLRANGVIRWIEPQSLTKPNGYLQLKLSIGMLSQSIGGLTKTPADFDYSLDNLYHYTFRDVYDMPRLSQADKDQNATLRLYPLTLTDLGDVADEAIAQKAVNHLVNQPLVTGAERGVTKYGAILYQLARKFFTGSCHDPSLAELITAGNDRPGWHVGTMQGAGVLSSFAMDLPHTVLGGMPYVCSGGSNPTDPCADGLPTWPTWVPDADPVRSWPEIDEEFVASLSNAKPGHSDRAALIYLGWASHILQDAATPHHAANWTGYEHDRQDAYGDMTYYWDPVEHRSCPDGTLVTQVFTGNTKRPSWAWKSCPDGSEPAIFLPPLYMSRVEGAAKPKIDSFFGTWTQPKTRQQICTAANIVDSQLFHGELNHKSTLPLFVDAAQDAFLARKEATVALSNTERNEYVIGYLSNALIATMKLLACAPPATVAACDGVAEPLNQGTIAGTQQRYPWDFNVFTFGDSFGLHDVGGPVAAGGELRLDSFNVNRYGLKPVAFVAKGNLALNNGTGYGETYVGSMASVPASATLYPAAVKPGTPIDFVNARENLIDVSSALAAQPANGTTIRTPSGVQFYGTSASYNVFTVSGAALADYRTFEFSIPEGATAIVNVVNDVPAGGTITIQNAGMNVKGTDYRRILWNFDDAQSISTASISFPGTALAPQAAVELKWGAFDGTLIAQSLNATYTEFHWQPFRGDLPALGL